MKCLFGYKKVGLLISNAKLALYYTNTTKKNNVFSRMQKKTISIQLKGNNDIFLISKLLKFKNQIKWKNTYQISVSLLQINF